MVRASNRIEIDGRRVVVWLMLMGRMKRGRSVERNAPPCRAAHTHRSVKDPEFLLPRSLPRRGPNRKGLIDGNILACAGQPRLRDR
jgi:hypothetical protein